MKNTLMMNFSVDKENKKINVEREFAAPIENVWAAWTQSEILDQWWAPKPWKARTKSMDFREGGNWIYAMVGPDGSEHWARADYKSIEPGKSFSGLDAFCDPQGNVSADMPRSMWKVNFTTEGDSTIAHIEITYDKLEDLEKTIEMGFKEGFTMGLQNLEDYFAKNA